MEIQKNKGYIQDNVGWQDGNNFYNFLYELEASMLDARINNDYRMMLMYFEEIVIIVKPYIYKLMLNEHKMGYFMNIDEIEQLENGFIPSPKYQDDRYHNNSINNKIIKILLKRKEVLWDYMARAGLQLPLHKDENDRPAALGNDD